MQPAHEISIGGTKYKTPDKTTITSVTVQTHLYYASATAEITLTEPGATHAPGDAVVIALGTDGTTTTVFTGVVQTVSADMQTQTITAGSAAQPLSSWQTDAVFEGKSSGAIVKELAGLLSLKVRQAEEGLTFPRYVISRQYSLWRHLRRLASYNGMLLYLTPGDELVMAAFAERRNKSYTWGQDILDLEKHEISPTLDGVEVIGESPAGQGQSDEAVSWFKKEAVTATAGKSTGQVARHVIYAARNKDLCQQIADNLFAASQTKAQGRAKVLGGEGLALGDTVSIQKMPQSAQNGNYLITGLEHSWSFEGGYTTELTWQASA